ncbi:LysE family translocator [Roseovarius aestuariivivens]|uniref:LysE family translocator n=1 Tax=Roseovarius aestuariivivens TaxID=1888910 RepID=UPI0010818FC2|nr:LysE family transporter [Roseovarius aestuariivivens]
MMGWWDVATMTSVVSFAFAAGSPGPATLAVAGIAMARGRRQGVAMALGLAGGLALWGVLAGMALGLLIAHFAPALLALKLIGAAYLFYLAFLSARSAMRSEGEEDSSASVRDESGLRMVRRGFLLNVLNPKAVLAWVAALALGAGNVVTIGLCAGLGLGIYLFYASVFSLRRVRAAYGRARRAIEIFFAGFFAWAGVRLLLWRATP